MKNLTKILFITVLIIFSNGVSFGQSLGGSQNSATVSEDFEHIDCGFRFPLPGKFTLSTSIDYSPYKELGQGLINRFVSNLAVYDIGCIDLDDPPRKMKKDELISSLNSMTKTYLADSSEFSALPSASVGGKEIYEFETKSNPQRRIKFIFEGNRVYIFLANSYIIGGIDEALKLFNSVTYFSVKETTEKRMKTATRKSIPQTPALKPIQTDASHNNLKGLVKSVRIESEDFPILVGKQERRIVSDETYDISGNLLKTFWFQDSGYPTSVSIYGFVGGARVSDSEEIEYDTTTTYGITTIGQDNAKLPPADQRYEERYAYKYDNSKRLIERKEYNNRGSLNSTYTFAYKDNFMEEKWYSANGKLNSTKRRQLDKDGNEIKYEFWWYEETDREIETYEYKKFDNFGNWIERQIVKKITDRGLLRTRTSNQFRTIIYYQK